MNKKELIDRIEKIKSDGLRLDNYIDTYAHKAKEKFEEDCNNLIKDILETHSEESEFVEENVEETECDCFNYEKYYHGGQKYGRCLDCGEEFEIY